MANRFNETKVMSMYDATVNISPYHKDKQFLVCKGKRNSMQLQSVVFGHKLTVTFYRLYGRKETSPRLWQIFSQAFRGDQPIKSQLR